MMLSSQTRETDSDRNKKAGKREGFKERYNDFSFVYAALGSSRMSSLEWRIVTW